MNNKTSAIVLGILAAVLVIVGVVWAMNKDDNKSTDTKTNTQQSEAMDESNSGSIVAIAADTPSLSTLVTAVKAADLVETLEGTGPFTVFAPTNDAFAALPEGTLANLLKPENVDQLKSILTYHVVSGKVMSSDLSDGQVVTTVQGDTLTVSIAGGKVYLTDAKGNKVMVEQADINADNGVVHVINGVLLPN